MTKIPGRSGRAATTGATLLVLIALATLARPALALDVTGVWELTSRHRSRAEVITITLEQHGDVLRGTGSVRLGIPREGGRRLASEQVTVEGRIARDGDVMLTVRRESGEDVLLEHLTGRIYRGEVSGIIGSGGGGRPFHGHRVDSAAGALPPHG
jgi:hypothetical protein